MEIMYVGETGMPVVQIRSPYQCHPERYHCNPTVKKRLSLPARYRAPPSVSVTGLRDAITEQCRCTGSRGLEEQPSAAHSPYLRQQISDLFVVDFEVARPHKVLHVVRESYLVEDVLQIQRSPPRLATPTKFTSTWCQREGTVVWSKLGICRVCTGTLVGRNSQSVLVGMFVTSCAPSLSTWAVCEQIWGGFGETI